jgi:ABC-2 type transport system permease protein
MPKVIQDLARFLPFQLSKYYPIQLILGRLSPAEIIQGYLMGFFWLAVSLLLFRWMWRNGVKKYSAVGA